MEPVALLINGFENYLSNRYQYVYLNKTNSNKLPVNCGVPQGSILGPIYSPLWVSVNSYPRQLVLCRLVPKSTRTQYQLVHKTTRSQYQDRTEAPWIGCNSQFYALSSYLWF